MAVIVLLLVAFVCALIAALIGFGVFAGPHLLGWIAAALLFALIARILSTVPSRP